MTRTLRLTYPRLAAFSLLALLTLLLACGSSNGAAAAGDETALIWEAWHRINESYASRAAPDPEAVVKNTIQHLLDLVDAPPYPLLTEAGRLRGQPPPGVPDQLADVWRALVLHQQKWPGLERSQVAEAAINGMVSGLGDPSAAFLSSKDYPRARKTLEESVEGNYFGIGARVVAQDDRLLLFPIQGTPAEKAGIQAGDILLAVEGDPVAGRSLQEVVGQVAGPEGTKVQLRLERPGKSEPLDVDILRSNINLPSVSRQLAPGGIGYVYISRFRDNTGEQVYEALVALKRIDMLALILDLRSNPGGSARAASDVVGQFLPPGSQFLLLEDRYGVRRETRVREDLDRLELGNLPMVVLVNGETVGEAEAVAGVLQETGRAVILGTRTFGKAGTYGFAELSNGSAIYLPTLKWYTPSGKLLGNGGIQPDISVPYKTVTEGLGGESQFNRAYAYLNERLPPFR